MTTGSWIRCSLWFAVLTATACSTRSSTIEPSWRVDSATPNPNQQLDLWIRQHIEARFGASPTEGSWLGRREFDTQLDDLSLEAQGRELARLRTLLDKLGTLREADLDSSHRIDRALLERQIQISLYELTDARSTERNPMLYVTLVSSSIGDLLAHEHVPLPERLRAIQSRLSRVRTLFDQARRNLKNPPDLLTRRAIDLAQDLRSFLAETLPRTVSAIGDEKMAAEFRPTQGEALRAIDDFVQWMQRELLPRSKGELALRKDKFLERLRIYEGGDVSFEELTSWTDVELQAARTRFEEAAKAVAPGKTPPEALRLIEEDHPTPEQLLAASSTTIEQLESFVRQHLLVTLPTIRPKVSEMPPFLWGFAWLAAPGILDERSHEPRFLIDPVDPSWNRKRKEEHLRALNRAQLLVTAIHEIYPGHWVQSEAARNAASLMQRVSRSDAMVEGWASYGTQLLIEQGFAEHDGRVALALARDLLVQACRFSIGLQLQTGQLKLDEGANRFSDEAYLDDASARREAERAAFDPLIVSSALGRLELVRLRSDVQAIRGDRFSLADFHERLLAHGALPLHLARKVLIAKEDHSAGAD